MGQEPYTSLDYALMIGLAALALIGGLLFAWYVVERIPHIEDEAAYLFQAGVFARGKLWAPFPADLSPYFTPFVVQVGGHWIGKYPIGWPLILALGMLFGAKWVVNPVLGALLVAVIYALGRDLFDRQIGVMAGMLTLTSPFFLISSSNFMSHAAGALWAALIAYGFLRVDRAHEQGRTDAGWAALIGFSAGMLAITRPLTVFGIILPFAVVIVLKWLREPRTLNVLIRQYWLVILIGAIVLGIQAAYLYLATGSPTTNLYLIVWPYDRVGFGPGHGVLPGGHTLIQGLSTTAQDLACWASILLGLPYLSWIPVALGVYFAARELPSSERFWVWLMPTSFLSLVAIYVAYWVGAEAYGPRYYYEVHALLMVLAAVGIRGASRYLWERWQKIRRDERDHIAGLENVEAPAQGVFPMAYWLLAILIMLNLVFYMPGQIRKQFLLYDITRAPLDQIQELSRGKPVLVMVRGNYWYQYAALFSENTPWFDGPIVALHDSNPESTVKVIALYPDREVWFYKEGHFSKTPPPY